MERNRSNPWKSTFNQWGVLLLSQHVVSDSLQPHGLQHTRLPCPSLSPRVCSNSSIESVMPSNHLIPCQSPCPPALSLSQHQGFFQWIGSSHQVVKVLELQLQHRSFRWIFRVDFFQDWLVWSCSLRDSQESSPVLQFENTNSFVLSLLYGPGLTLVHDY